jgi:hypothetical protein
MPQSPLYLKIVALAVIVTFIARYLIRWRKSNRHKKFIKIIRRLDEVGHFADESKFIAFYGATHRRKLSEIEIIEFVPIRIKIAKPSTHNNAKWSAQVGHLDVGAYNTALTIYESSLNQWAIGKENFKQQERLAKTIDKYHATRGYNVKKPTKPNRADFVKYAVEKGDCFTIEQHPFVIASTSSEILTKKFGKIPIDLVRHEARILLIYAELFEKVFSDKIAVIQDSKFQILQDLEDHYLESKLSDKIDESLKLSAQKHVGEFFKNLEVSRCAVDVTRNEFLFPLGVVITQNSRGMIEYGFVDHANPRIELV